MVEFPTKYLLEDNINSLQAFAPERYVSKDIFTWGKIVLVLIFYFLLFSFLNFYKIKNKILKYKKKII